MTIETVDYGESFAVELIAPSQQCPGVKAFQPREVLSATCQIYPTHLLISMTQYGKTKYASYLLGPIGAYVLRPLFGSLSPKSSSLTLPWDKIEKASYVAQGQEINIVGVFEGQKQPCLVAFKCAQSELLLANLAAFVSVEGVESPGRVLSRQLPDEVIFLNDLGGYGKTAWGMTEEEVLRAEAPRVERLEKPGEIAGGTATLGIKELQTHAGKFRADFIFGDSNRRLIQVNLTSLEEKDRRANSAAVSVLEKLLTEKYGAPKIENLPSKHASWELTKTVIQLVHLDLQPVASLVVICYKSPTAASGASKNP